jgi:Beta-galactosidase
MPVFSMKLSHRRALRAAVWLLAFASALKSPLAAADSVPLRQWTDYRTIMWIGDTAYKKPDKLPLFFQRLREMGINAAMVHHDAPSKALLDAKMPYYVENMVNKGLCLKWNSRVSDWDKMVTAWKTPRDEAGLVREYGLDDPQWRAWARGEMQRLVRANAPHQPLAYDIRDELSTTISANPFDYDFSPTALAGFRVWLKTQYAGLAALNAEWETTFAAWDDVKPFTTDQIKNRMASGDAIPRGKPDWQAVQALKFDPIVARKKPTAWNLSPWCDFRSYMDSSLASALDDIRQAARELDPRTPVGIEGTQMPSAFGGYDLWKLSRVLDWIEPYDIGNAREILGSFMPGKPILTTVGEQDANAARRRLWHLLLEGDRGCIVWWSEDCIDWKSDDYALTPRAAALAPVLKELQSPLAHVFMRAEREYDPIAIHYSQASIQVDWLLESCEDGSTWLRRFSSYEATHNRMARRRQAWVKLLQDAGYTPRFVSSAQIESGGLKDFRALLMCDSICLSSAEAKEISFFYASAGKDRWLMGTGLTSYFDEHGKLRNEPLLVQLSNDGKSFDNWPGSERWNGWLWLENGNRGGFGEAADITEYLSKRVHGRPNPSGQVLDQFLESFPPPVRVPQEACIRVHRYRLGAAGLVAFERNIVWQMSEDLKQKGGNEALEKPVAFDAKLAAPAHIYDLRSGKYLGQSDRITVHLDPWQPSLFALLPQRIPGDDALAALTKLAGAAK